tara:strand:+ start:3874 stop:4071 length:198 start_codon:yes stop_codon:yes gene_type:complete
MIKKSFYKNASIGSWIRDEFRNDRSLGYVLSVDQETDMMLVRYPKIAKDIWLVRENRGQYITINN